MNLEEFFNYKKNCSSCNSTLDVIFHSHKYQVHTYENNRFVAMFNLNSMRNKKEYKVGYSINLENNSFFIDFYKKDYSCEEQISLSLLKRFRELDNNLNKYKIHKTCTLCNKYNYSSNSFTLDYKKCSIGDLTVSSEYIILYKQFEDGYKCFSLINFYESNETWIDSFNSNKISPVLPFDTFSHNKIIKTGLINISNTESLFEKINKLMIFA